MLPIIGCCAVSGLRENNRCFQLACDNVGKDLLVSVDELQPGQTVEGDVHQTEALLGIVRLFNSNALLKRGVILASNASIGIWNPLLQASVVSPHISIVLNEEHEKKIMLS